jgi:NAD+ kinase
VKVALHAHPNKPAALALARRIRSTIGGRCDLVLSEEARSLDPSRPSEGWEALRADALVAVGGDGTFLRALRRTSVPLLPVNAGTIGVLAEVDGRSPGLEQAIDRLLERRYFVEERAKLAAEAGSEPVPDVTNEYVVHASPVGRMGTFEVALDGRPLALLRADGVIVATPTGSTAYALSSAGPIVEPTVDAVVLTAIAPFRAEARAIVLGGLRTVRIRPTRVGGSCVLIADGEPERTLEAGEAVTIYRSPRQAALVRFGASFFDRLRGKRIVPWAEEEERRPDADVPAPS